MAEPVLPDLHRGTQGIQQSRVTMPEGMSRSLQAQLLENRLEMPLHKIVWFQTLPHL
jgi:hypothetical protein